MSSAATVASETNLLPTSSNPNESKNVGRWKPGQSGNPKGRPKASLVSLQRDLEGAIRDHLTADKVKRIIDKMVSKACEGDVKAAKLILDKLVPNATDAADVGEAGRVVVFRVENATFLAQQKQPEPKSNPPIDAVVEVIESTPSQESSVEPNGNKA